MTMRNGVDMRRNVGERERLTQGRVVAYFRDTSNTAALRTGNTATETATSKRSCSPTGSRIGP